jgi:hypothetical protein
VPYPRIPLGDVVKHVEKGYQVPLFHSSTGWMDEFTEHFRWKPLRDVQPRFTPSWRMHGSWNQRSDQPLLPRETPSTSLGLRIPSDEGEKPSQEHPRRLESERLLSLCRVTVKRWSKLPVMRAGIPLMTQ